MYVISAAHWKYPLYYSNKMLGQIKNKQCKQSHYPLSSHLRIQKCPMHNCHSFTYFKIAIRIVQL